MTEEFRIEICRYCKNRSFDPKKGTICGLQELPQIQNNHCPDFNPDYENYDSTQNRKWQAEKEEESNFFNIYWYVGGLLVSVLVGIIAASKKDDLEKNYRWTIAEPIEVKEEWGWDYPFYNGYLYSEYLVNHEHFQNKLEIDFIYETGESFKPMFIRYDPSDPSNSEIQKFEYVPEYIDINQVPSNGIHKDSLEFFARRQLESYNLNNSRNNRR